MFCKSGRIFCGTVGKCAAGHQTKLFQFFSTLGKGEDEGEVFYRKYTFLFELVDKFS
jgi:hypothetical protein